MPPPLPYFKVNICPLPLPHFASIFFRLFVILSQKCEQEEFEDTKEVIRIRISKKNRQHNGLKKKYNDLQNIHLKLKIE